MDRLVCAKRSSTVPVDTDTSIVCGAVLLSGREALQLAMFVWTTAATWSTNAFQLFPNEL